MSDTPPKGTRGNKTEDFFEKLWEESGLTETDRAIFKYREENDFTLQLAALVGILGSKYPDCEVTVGAYYPDPEPAIYDVFVTSKIRTGTEKDLIAEFMINSGTWRIEAYYPDSVKNTCLKDLIRQGGSIN